MQIDLQLSAMLVKCEDVPGAIYAWCPQLDVATQGDNIEHALAMLQEACIMMVEADLYSFSYRPDGSYDRDRIRHPLRRGDSAREDDMFPVVEQYMESRGSFDCTIAISPAEFVAGPETIGFVGFRLEVSTRCGLVFVNGPSRYDGVSVHVPARSLRVNYVESVDRSYTIDIRSTDVPDETALMGRVKTQIHDDLTRTDGHGHRRLGHRGQKIQITSVRLRERR